MKKNKILAGLLSVIFLTAAAAAPVAANPAEIQAPAAQAGDIMPISAPADTVDSFKFGSFTGTVKKITKHEGTSKYRLILVEDEAGKKAHIVVTDETYILDNAEITEGATITGYYNANAPRIMIYPPQYPAEVVVVNNSDYNVKVDIFDKALVSSDNTLKLNISAETSIVSREGNDFSGDLAQRKLAVVYDISTRSIPAQTTPQKVIILSDSQLLPEQPEIGDVTDMDIIVNDKVIEAPEAYKDVQGTVMVSLRAIAEALGFNVTGTMNCTASQLLLQEKGDYQLKVIPLICSDIIR